MRLDHVSLTVPEDPALDAVRLRGDVGELDALTEHGEVTLAPDGGPLRVAAVSFGGRSSWTLRLPADATWRRARPPG